MNRTNLLIDTGVFAAFLLAMNPVLTGIPWHEWLSIALAATIIIHLLLHWRWITGVLARFFKKLWHESRLKFVVDTLLFIAFTAIMMSGILISQAALPFFGIHPVKNDAWHEIHSFSAEVGMWLLALHFALSWKWIVKAVQLYVLAPIAQLFKTPQPVARTAKMEEK